VTNEQDTALTRSELLRKLQIYSFAATEANLFLDTHPDNKEAFSYFLQVSNACRKLQDEFAHKFGPLRAEDEIWEQWNWVDEPWPWELEAQ
jgi:spore coat protein JB